MQYGVPQQQARVQQVKPQGSQIEFGNFAMEYTTNAQHANKHAAHQ